MKNLSSSILIMLSILFFIIGLLVDKPMDILRGLGNIIVHPDLLLVDYFAIGGIGASFINASLTMGISIIMVYKSKSEFTGPVIAALLTILGFSFMGKNFINVLPLYLGGYLYSIINRVEMKSILVGVLFGTTLAPAITVFAFGLDNIPLSILVGASIGYIVTPLSKQMIKLHEGFNLYNIGFTGGIIATGIASTLRALGIEVEMEIILSSDYSIFIRNIIILISIVSILIGFIVNDKSFIGYSKIFKYSGQLITDFKNELGDGIAFINMGLMGIISSLYVILVGGHFNGPVLAGIFTVIGFSSFGKHPINSIPILLGVYLATHITVFEPGHTAITIAALFGTTLAPITGKYGILAGIGGGILHLLIVTNLGDLHGGINLYNNGFAGGIVACILIPILNLLKNKNFKIESLKKT